MSRNVQTRAAAGYAEHPVRTLLRHGVPVTLNTDNPRTSATTLRREYDLAATLTGLTDDELALVAHHSLEASFLLLSLLPRLQHRNAGRACTEPSGWY